MVEKEDKAVQWLGVGMQNLLGPEIKLQVYEGPRSLRIFHIKDSG